MGRNARALGALIGLAAGVGGCVVVTDKHERCEDAAGCSAPREHLWSVIAIEDRATPTYPAFPVNLAVSRDGGAFLGTSFRGSVDLGGGPLAGEGSGGLWDVDIALARRDENGKLLWTQSFVGPGMSTLGGMAAKGADHLVLAGTFSERLEMGGAALTAEYPSGFVAELDGNGKTVWTRTLLLDDLAILEIGPVALAGGGDVILGGAHDGTMDLGGVVHPSGADRTFVARFDAQGAPRWARTIGTSTDDRPRALAVDGAGGVVVAEDSAKGYLMWVSRLDAGGDLLWRKRIRGTVSDVITPHALVAWGSGESLLVGHATGLEVTGPEDLDLGAGPAGCFAVKLDAQGAVAWAERFEAACFEAAAVDGAGRIVLGGWLTGTERIGDQTLASDRERPLLVELDANGDVAWARLAAGSGEGRAEALGLDALGRVLAGGSFQGTLEFGGRSLTSAGDGGAYFLSLQRRP